MFRAWFRHSRTLLGRERNIKVNNYDRVVEFILEIMHVRLLFLVLSPMWGGGVMQSSIEEMTLRWFLEGSRYSLSPPKRNPSGGWRWRLQVA